MSTKLQLKTETLRTLVSSELDGVFGGVAVATSSARPTGPVAQPTATAVSSAKPGHGTVSSVLHATATAVSSALHATATAVSSARHFSSISSIVPTGRP